MIATWSGRHFEISGIASGTVAAWEFVREGGRPMSEQQFEALSPDGQRWLADVVRIHIERQVIDRPPDD